ncbi:hypothetical protein AVEN_110101-1, partial [Araneus ventricosus]
GDGHNFPEIMTIAKELGVEVNEEDIEEVVTEHENDLNTGEF